MGFFSIAMIRLYQRTLSFDHGPIRRYFLRGAPPMCRYYPTCSDYGIAAIEKYGFIKGWKMTLVRILSCHPFSQKHPFDPVP